MSGRFLRLIAAFSLLFCAAILPSIGSTGDSDAAKLESIRSEIRAARGSSALKGAKVSIEVRDASTGKIIYSHNPDRKLIPASNMKIITAAAAIELLKPEYRFKTEIYADAPIKKGVIKGNIYIKGYGDPLLVDEQLWTIARDVAYRGVLQVTGKVLADDSYFDDQRYGQGWGELGPEAYNAPLGALSLNFNTFVITAMPGERVGMPPRVFLMPPDRHLEVTNRAKTVASGRSYLKVVEVPEKVNAYNVIGHVPLGAGVEEVRRTIGDPGLYTAGSFEAYLMSWGIVTSGKIGRKQVPANARLLISHQSPPLSRALLSMGKISNNFVSEQILKTMGAVLSEEGKIQKGTTGGGIKVVQRYLKRLGIEPGSYTMVDASGLSRMNRLTARQINTVLVRMYRVPTFRPEFMSSMGVGGVDGTIEDRFKVEPLHRKVRAKTGHLNGVNTLSGYLLTERGKMLAFSILFNGFSGYHSSVERQQEKILMSLSRY